MEESNHTTQSAYTFGDVVLESENFRLYKDGKLTRLTPRSFDVLVYLIERSGRVVEKQELFDAVWKDTFVTDNALMRVIKEIRRELGDDANHPRYIETVHKRGYRFIADAKKNSVVNGKSSERSPTLEEAEDVQNPRGPRGGREAHVRTNGKKWLLIAITLSAVSIVSFSLLAYRNNNEIASVAVMPFLNESGSPEMEYLSDGMTERLIGSLSQLPNLSVKARTSVFRYKGKEMDLHSVARELNVQALLIGRVVHRGDNLNIYLSLVDASTENNIWSKHYDRKLKDLIDIQNEIARDAANSLGAKLSDEAELRVTKSYTTSVEAQQLYDKGRHHLLTTGHLGAETGMRYYLQAVQLDPNYARAYAGMAEVAIGLAFGSEMPSAEVFSNAKAAAIKAVEIDPELAEGHTALGFISMWYDWDWQASEAHIRRAIDIDANNADAHLAQGILLCNTGRTDAGLAALRRSIELDPLNLRNRAVEAQYHNFAGKSDEAFAAFQSILELEPNFYIAHLFLSSTYCENGKFPEAIDEALTARKLNPVGSPPKAFLGYALGRSGQKAEARAVLNELLEASSDRYISPYSIAMIYNGLDERDETLKWLKRGVEARDLRMTFLKSEPKWNHLRDDPRFRELMGTVGLQ